MPPVVAGEAVLVVLEVVELPLVRILVATSLALPSRCRQVTRGTAQIVTKHCPKISFYQKKLDIISTMHSLALIIIVSS